jgi:hypothetical protein
VVDDQIADRISAKRIITISRIRRAATKSHVAYNDVVRLELYGVARDTNSVTGRSIAGNRDVRRSHANPILELNDSRHIENHDPRPGGFTSRAKTTRATIIQISYNNHSAASPPKRVHPAAPSTRKRRNFCLGQIAGCSSTREIRFSSISPIFDFRQRAREYFVRKTIRHRHALISLGLNWPRHARVTLPKTQGAAEHTQDDATRHAEWIHDSGKMVD